MSLDTKTALLGTSQNSDNQITIISSGIGISTDGFTPNSAETTDKTNPIPVAGYATEINPWPLCAQDGTCDPQASPSHLFLHQPEIVIGTDDRQLVNTPASWPYSVQGHMIMKFPNGKIYIGSGTMIGRHHVITAGHCVYSKADGGWATSVQFNAAQNGGSLPFGSVYATRLISVSGWTESNDSAFDMGMLILESDLGVQTGWFGIITIPNDSELIRKRVNVTGYPGDKGGTQLWTHSDVVKSLTQENAYYDIDTMGGQSGSGVWSTFTGHNGEKVACIHTTGAGTGNGSTRISKAKFDRIVEWMQTY